MSRFYVDGFLNAGTLELEKLTETTLQRFESNLRVHDSLDFYDAQVHTIKSGSLEITQRYYIKNLYYIEMTATFNEFRLHQALI